MTVQEYIDALPAERRPLYDRIHRLVLEAHPDAALAFSYQMPTFKGGRRRLYVGVWRHGVSMYGWGQDRDAGFAASSSAAPLPPMTFPCDRGHTGMITEPKIVERGYRRYVALRHTTDIPGLPALVDAGFPRLAAHLAARGVEPAGVPFIRYRTMTGGTMDIDLGLPYASDLDDDGWADDAISVERLPAGRHAQVVHHGPFRGLVTAHAAIDDWAGRTSHVLDSDLGARVEHYLTDPRSEPDSAKWATEVEEPLLFAPEPTETTSLGTLYGLPARNWADAHRQLADTHAIRTTTWLSTVNADGRPHAAAVGALFVEGTWWFTSGPGTRKSRDLNDNPRCSVSTATAGMDIAVEGRAERITDPQTLRRMAAVYSSQGWPATATDDGFTAEYSAPSAGPPPWFLYRLAPEVAFAVGTAEPYGATRWRF